MKEKTEYSVIQKCNLMDWFRKNYPKQATINRQFVFYDCDFLSVELTGESSLYFVQIMFEMNLTYCQENGIEIPEEVLNSKNRIDF